MAVWELQKKCCGWTWRFWGLKLLSIINNNDFIINSLGFGELPTVLKWFEGCSCLCWIRLQKRPITYRILEKVEIKTNF